MAKEKSDMDRLRDEVARLSGLHRQTLAKLERSRDAMPELRFAQIHEILAGLKDVDDVFIQLAGRSYDYHPGPSDAPGVKTKAWKSEITWRLYIRRYLSGKFADRSASTCFEAIKQGLEAVGIPMPAELEKLANEIDQ